MPRRLPSTRKLGAAVMLAAAFSACGGSSQPAPLPGGPELTLRRSYALRYLDASASTVTVEAIDGCDQGTFSYAMQTGQLALAEVSANGQAHQATFVGSSGELAGEWTTAQVPVCETPWTFCLPRLLIPQSGVVGDTLALKLTISADTMELEFDDAQPALNEVMLSPLIDALPEYITSFRYYWADAFSGWAQSPLDPAMRADITGSLDDSRLTLTFSHAAHACTLVSDLSARMYEDFSCADSGTALTAAQLEFRSCVEQSGFMKP